MMQLNCPAPRLADKLADRDFGKLEAIVARALEKDRDQRYATAAEFANALSELGFRPSYQTPVADVMDCSAAAPTSRLSGNKGFATALVADIQTPSPATNPSLALPENPKSRRLLAIGAAAAVVGIAVAIVGVMRGGTSRAPEKPPAPITGDTKVVAVATAVTESDPVADIVIQADALAASGRFKPAIDLLIKSRRTYPKAARLPLRAGKLYVDKLFFADGIPLLRAAFALDSKYRSDPGVIKSLLRGFNATASYDGAIARFLREDVGTPAKPYLQETASSHPNPIVRNRAKLELKSY